MTKKKHWYHKITLLQVMGVVVLVGIVLTVAHKLLGLG